MSACQTVESISARRDVLSREGRCYICLKRGDIADSCRSQSRCFTCKGNHHSAICHEQIFEQRKEPETETLPKTPEKAMNLRADITNSMLLQTAQVLTCHPAGQKKVVRARAIFDSGSQRSYILGGTKQLNLPTVAKENIFVNVFGNSHGTEQIAELCYHDH